MVLDSGVAIPRAPNRIDFSSSLEDRNRTDFRNVLVLIKPDDGQSPK